VLGNSTLALPEGKPATLVALTSHQGPLVDRATVSLPLATWAEVDGTFTNRQGHVQRIRTAVKAPGEVAPGWRLIDRLAGALGGAFGFASAEAVFAEAKGRYPFMKDAAWGPPLAPVHLRFGESRG